MTKSCDLEYVKKVIEDNSSIEYLIELYEDFCSNFSCRPLEEKFPKCETGDIIDEDKSVKWNKEEVEKRIIARENEVKRLNTLKNKIHDIYINGIHKKIVCDWGITLKEVELLWSFFYGEYHPYGIRSIYSHLNDFMNTYDMLRKLDRRITVNDMIFGKKRTIDEVIEWLDRRAYRLNRYREKIIEFPEYLTIIRWLEELKERRESEKLNTNDTCEYSIKNDLVFVGCTNESIASRFAFYNELGDYKYCPYCGKKVNYP